MTSKALPTRMKANEFPATSLEDLPSFTKRSRVESVETPDQDWGGGSSAQVAPTRRERGKWIPPSGSRFKGRPIESSQRSEIENPDSANIKEQRKDTTSWYGRRGRGSKKAKLDIFDAPRFELPPPLQPVGDPSKVPSTGSESDDQPKRATPPPEVNWASKANEAPPERISSIVSAGQSHQRDVPGGQQREISNLSSVRSGISPSGRNQLPPDHPLMIHLASLQCERENRKFQWAGLIDTLGDEFRNPASYDRQLWLKEEQMADEAIVETMLQIKMAERGLDAGIEDVQPTERGGVKAMRGGHRRRGHGGGNKRHRRSGRYFDNHQNRASIPLHKQDPITGGVHVNFRGRKENAPSKRPMRWDEERKEDAVRTWLREMGMPEQPPAPAATTSTSASDGRRELLTLDRLPTTKPTTTDIDDDDGERSFISLGLRMSDDDGGNREDDEFRRPEEDAHYLDLVLAPSDGMMAGHGRTSPWSSPVRSVKSNLNEDISQEVEAEAAVLEPEKVETSRAAMMMTMGGAEMKDQDEQQHARQEQIRNSEPMMTIKIEPGLEEEDELGNVPNYGAGGGRGKLKLADFSDLYDEPSEDDKGYDGFMELEDDEEESGVGVGVGDVETVDMSQIPEI